MGPRTRKSWLTWEVEGLVNNPAIHERPGAKALKISQIWKSLLRAHVENIFMKELEGERRHSWSNSSILGQLRWKVKGLDGAEHRKVMVDTEKLEVLVTPAIHKRPGAKALKISSREPSWSSDVELAKAPTQSHGWHHEVESTVGDHNPAQFHKGPGAKVLKITQILKLLLKAHIEKTYSWRNLKAKRRHSKPDLSILDSWNENLKV